MRPHPFHGMTLILAMLLAGCGTRIAPGPPTIHYGQDACAGCGMIISDERFASALIDTGGDVPPLLFDDIGCMLQYEHDRTAPATNRYFHDAETRKWISESDAILHKSHRDTPMGSGLIALSLSRPVRSPATRSDNEDVFIYQQLREQNSRTNESVRMN